MAQQSIVHNIIFKGVLNIFNTLLPLIITPYVYRILGPSSMGNVEYAMTLLSYFTMLGMFGIYNYGLREISANRNHIERVQMIYKNLFATGILSNLLFLSLYVAFIYFLVKDPAVRLISWILCGNLLAQIFYVEWFNEAMEKFRFITIKTIIVRSLSLLILLIVKTPEDLYKYVFITVSVTFVNYLGSFIYSQYQIGIHLKDYFKGLNIKVYLIPLLTVLVLNNTGILYTVVDRTLLGHFIGAESVAYFSIGQKIVELTKTLLLSIVFATLPRLSFYLKEDKPLYQSGILKIMQVVLLLIIPSGIGLLLLSRQVIWLFGGVAYAAAVPAMRIFALRIILLGVEAVLYNQIIFLHGKEKILLKYNLLCGCLNIVLNLVLLRVLTPFISIACTFVSEVLFLALCMVYIHRRLDVKMGIFTKRSLHYLLVSLGFIPIVLAVQHLVNSQIAIIAWSLGLCVALYVVVLRILKDEALLMIGDRMCSLIKRK